MENNGGNMASVMGCRSFQNIALGGLCKTHNKYHG